jgi:hypothetical protein
VAAGDGWGVGCQEGFEDGFDVVVGEGGLALLEFGQGDEEEERFMGRAAIASAVGVEFGNSVEDFGFIHRGFLHKGLYRQLWISLTLKGRPGKRRF